jgi:hypothetical protein
MMVAPLPEELVERQESPEAKSESQGSQSAYAWDLVARVISCESPDDLLEFIDLGLPESLFDQLYGQLEDRWSHTVGEAANVRLIRANVIDSFFGPLVGLRRDTKPVEVVMTTPWITPWHGPRSSLKGLLRYLKHFSVRTTILTRPPELAAHKRALDYLGSISQTEIVYLPDLHAKFFICDVAPTPFALVASANSTAKSYSNFEVGVFVRGSGRAEGFVRDLQGLAIELRGLGKCMKRRGSK